MTAISHQGYTADSIVKVTGLFAGFFAVLLIHEAVVGSIRGQVMTDAVTGSAEHSALAQSAQEAEVRSVSSPVDVSGDPQTPPLVAEVAPSADASASADAVSEPAPLPAGTLSVPDTVADSADTVSVSAQGPLAMPLEEAVEEPLAINHKPGPQDDSASVLEDRMQAVDNHARASASELTASPADDPAASNRSAQATELAPEAEWSAVWRPFYSLRTAEGFANYISDSTGLDLRVSESRIPGQYLVEVRHATELERLEADRLIVQTTGYKPADALR